MSANAFYNTSVGGGGVQGFDPVSRQSPRSVMSQLFNRPAYQRNRVTGNQLAEMERSNQDRYRAEVIPLQTAFNRAFNENNQRQQMQQASVANQAANQYLDATSNYNNSLYDLNRAQRNQNLQMLWPMLSQYFGA
jgi:hypothetical protein